jgi:DNA-binding response OmpR family regulator
VGVGAMLDGSRVLIVEDEAMIAALLESILAEAGCSIVGPVPTINQAMETIERDKIDVAVLDVRVNGDEVYPIVDRLLKSHIPIMFVSGYSQQDLCAGYRHHAFISKPFDAEEVVILLEKVLTAGGWHLPQQA